MNWKECMQEKIYERKTNPKEAKSLLKMAEIRQKDNERREVTEENVSLIVETHWEVQKQLTTALLILEGYKSYSQECLIEFLKQKHDLRKSHAQKMHQLRRLRNDIDYRGKFLDRDYLDRNQDKIQQITENLKQKLEKELE
jgi:MoxR-like ATPase